MGSLIRRHFGRGHIARWPLEQVTGCINSAKLNVERRQSARPLILVGELLPIKFMCAHGPLFAPMAAVGYNVSHCVYLHNKDNWSVLSTTHQLLRNSHSTLSHRRYDRYQRPARAALQSVHREYCNNDHLLQNRNVVLSAAKIVESAKSHRKAPNYHNCHPRMPWLMVMH